MQDVSNPLYQVIVSSDGVATAILLVKAGEASPSHAEYMHMVAVLHRERGPNPNGWEMAIRAASEEEACKKVLQSLEPEMARRKEIPPVGRELEDKIREFERAQQFHDKNLIPILSRNSESADPNGVHTLEFETYTIAGRMTFPAKIHGEYFDFRMLNEDYLAVIMCDASPGFGLGPLLTKARIAGFFNDLCNEVSDQLHENPGAKPTIGNWIYYLNESVESRKMPMNLQIHFIDTKAGTSTVSYAGDNWIHYWDSEKRSVGHYRLGDVPGAGEIPKTYGYSSFERYAGPYQETQIQLRPGDVLLFLNDGLQQSRRYFRNEAGDRIPYDQCSPKAIEEDIARSGIEFPLNASDLVSGDRIEDAYEYIRGFGRAVYLWPRADEHSIEQIRDPGHFAELLVDRTLPYPFRLLTGHGLMVHNGIDKYEEFGARRMFKIVDKVMNRQTYTLELVGDRPFGYPLVFDFSNAAGKSDEIIRAVFAIERVFRLLPDAAMDQNHVIRINSDQVDFLRKHLGNFSRLFTNEPTRESGNVSVFSQLAEVAQERIFSLWSYEQK